MPATHDEFDDVLVVIPARLRSTRLPGKPLISIAGVPMIVRTAERCFEAVPRERVIVATDDPGVFDVCRAHDIRVEMTREDHPTGTDRVAEIATRFPARMYINVQGDEPVLDPDDITRVIEASRLDPSKVYVGYCEMTAEQWHDSKNVKVLFGLDNRLLYIGRAQVPGSHDGSFRVAYRQVCVYAFTREALDVFASVPARTPLEALEDVEAMRFLELGVPVDVVALSSTSISVDRPDDVEKVESYLAGLASGADGR